MNKKLIQDGFENWKEVWSKKTLPNNNEPLLKKLLTANGFDTGAGDYSLENWIELTRFIAAKAKINHKSSICEVGCGSGAFLLGIQNQTNCRIFGVDYSESLISIARDHIKGEFICCDAASGWKLSSSVSVVISHSVFNYFPSIEYSNRVILNISRNLIKGGNIVLMDLNNEDKKDSYHEFRYRKSKDPEKYKEKYEFHPHLFFNKDEFEANLIEAGFGLIEFFENPIKDYQNGQFRFNLIATKLI